MTVYYEKDYILGQKHWFCFPRGIINVSVFTKSSENCKIPISISCHAQIRHGNEN
jgi:hypothetical protein